MRDDLDKKLCAEFPSIFRDRHGDMKDTCMVWGFPGDGWYDLVRNICLFIENALANAKSQAIFRYKQKNNIDYMADLSPEVLKELKVDEMRVVADQVKEKYGTLRFYWHGDNLPEDTWAEINGAVSMAEMLSDSICENCGERGEMRGPGWMSVKCDKCSEGVSTMKEFLAWEDEQEKKGLGVGGKEWAEHKKLAMNNKKAHECWCNPHYSHKNKDECAGIFTKPEEPK
jgi:hypothetical protein